MSLHAPVIPAPPGDGRAQAILIHGASDDRGHQRARHEGAGRARPRGQRRRALGLVSRADLERRRRCARRCATRASTRCWRSTPTTRAGARRRSRPTTTARAARPAAACEFTATAGVDYYIAVDGRDGARGTFTLRLRACAANDAFAAAAPLSALGRRARPSSRRRRRASRRTRGVGRGAVGLVHADHHLAADARALDMRDLDGADADRRLRGHDARDAHARRRGGPLARLRGGQRRARHVAPAGQPPHTYRIAVDAAPAPTSCSTRGTPPSNDDRADAELHLRRLVPYDGTTRVATHEAGEPDHAGAGGGASVWYAVAAVRPHARSVSTCASHLHATRSSPSTRSRARRSRRSPPTTTAGVRQRRARAASSSTRRRRDVLRRGRLAARARQGSFQLRASAASRQRRRARRGQRRRRDASRAARRRDQGDGRARPRGHRGRALDLVSLDRAPPRARPRSTPARSASLDVDTLLAVYTRRLRRSRRSPPTTTRRTARRWHRQPRARSRRPPARVVLRRGRRQEARPRRLPACASRRCNDDFAAAGAPRRAPRVHAQRRPRARRRPSRASRRTAAAPRSARCGSPGRRRAAARRRSTRAAIHAARGSPSTPARDSTR